MKEITIYDQSGTIRRVRRGSVASIERAATKAMAAGLFVREGAPPQPEGYRVGPEGFEPITLTPQERLDQAKLDAAETVLRAVKVARLRYITDLPGQEAIYQEKRDEASRYISEGRPSDLFDYPMLAAEAGVTAPTASDLADMWIALNMQWKEVAAKLEKNRMTAIKAVEAATDRAEIDAALETLNAALAALQP